METESTHRSTPSKSAPAADAAPLSNHHPTERSVLWRSLGGLCRILTSVLFDLKVFGLEHVPRTGGAIIAANHQSYLDPVLLAVRLPRPLSFLAKSELFTNRYFGWLIRSLHAFPVRQGAGDVAAMRESIRRVKEGHLLNVFPEGTRTEDGKLGPILSGVALMVRRANVPVIPAVVDGAFEAWPPHKKLPRPYSVIVLYGPAMDFTNLKGEQITQLIERTFRSMLDETARIRREVERNDPWLKRSKAAE